MIQGPTCHRAVFRSLKKCELTEFDGKVHSIIYHIEEICQGESGESLFRIIYMETRGVKA